MSAKQHGPLLPLAERVGPKSFAGQAIEHMAQPGQLLNADNQGGDRRGGAGIWPQQDGQL